MVEFNYNPLEIFSEIKSLKPETFIFGNADEFWFTHKNCNKTLHYNDGYTFSKSTKNVRLIFEIENIDCIGSALRCFNHYELDSFVLRENFTRFLTADSMKCQTFSNLAILESSNIVSGIHFNVHKCEVNVWASSDPLTEEQKNTLICNIYGNISLNERYLHMKSAKIVFPYFGYEYYDLEDAEIMSIIQGLF
uniref:TLDc domain-containing protein n=1 Tax=Strongyloides venezuelensis TaxID=75913 RepID=A0A0K0F7M3_STRVS